MFGNLLNMALQVVPKQEFKIYKWQERTQTEDGLIVNSYFEPVTILGSIQPVKNSNYSEGGRMLAKKSITAWIPYDAINLTREKGNDLIEYHDQFFEIQAPNDWIFQDDWIEVEAVHTENSPNYIR